MLLPFVRFMFPYKIFYRGVPRFATDCLYGVGCHGLTVCWSTATAVLVVTSSGDESFEFSTTYRFLFNSGSNYSLNWRHIVMKLQHPVYNCLVNNISKHEGWYCQCGNRLFSSRKQVVPGGLFLLHLLNYSCVTWVRVPLLVCKFDIMETRFSLFLIPFKHN